MPSIVCAIDSDVLRSVKRGASNGRLALYDARRASYDASVVQALQRIGFAFQLVGVEDQFSRSLSEIEALNPELVFNLALSATPSESAFVDGLASRELAYTGSGASAITATNDKIRMRRLLKKFNIPIPKYSVFYPKRRPRSLEGTSPHIVKPAKFGATSDGIKPSSMVWTYEQARKQADRIATTLDVPAICDEFIIGREFHVGLVERRGILSVTAVAELKFMNAPAGFGFKSELVSKRGGQQRYFEIEQVLVDSPRKPISAIAKLAQRAASCVGVRGYAKVDIRVDGDGRPFVLEVNSNPGLWSGMPIWSRPSFEENISSIVRAALSR
jgi:D-alanine-D-alanine ligase